MIKEYNNTYELHEFSKFKATGINKNGVRLKPIISDNYFYIEGINLWHGNKWGLLKINNKWKKLQSINN